MIFSGGTGMNLPSEKIRRGIIIRGVAVLRDLVICVFICIFLCIPAHAVDGDGYDATQPVYDYNRVHGFMNHLFRMGEYSRARDELYRIKSLYPALVPEDRFRVTETHFLFKEGMYEEVLKSEGEPPLLGLYRFDSLVALGRMEESEKVIRRDFGNITGPWREMVKRRQLLSELLNDRTVATTAAEAGMQGEDIKRIIEYTRSEKLKRKNPWMGTGLSVLPGCGYIYADQALTGIVACIVISGLSVLTYYAFRTDNRPAGVVFGAAAVFFYGGSMVGGYRDTLRYNHGIDDKCRRYLDTKLALENDRRRIVRSFGLVTENDSR